MYIANIPLFFIWVWFALRAGKPFFFSAVNPAIETGGAWGESKHNILCRIPQSHRPKTVLVEKGTDISLLGKKMAEAGLGYPVIAKPDVGERGTLVSKIHNEPELAAYLAKNNIRFLVQEFVSWPVELAVMHHRLPGQATGRVTSVCIKETLKVIGDGRSTVRQLMEKNARSKLQLERFEKYFPEILNEVPENQQTRELEPIGNHCRGTMFLNGNHHIDEKLNAVFDEVASQMEGIHYGRFDLKCRSVADLKNGNGFLAMEYNGIGAEPAHIYDPAYPLAKKYRDIYDHWKIIFRIYKIQKKHGVKAMSVREAIDRLRTYINYQKSLNL